MSESLPLDQLLAAAVDQHRDRLTILAVARLLLGSARHNAKRPAYLKVAVPDELVMNVRGKPELADAVLLVRIPREVVDGLA